MATVWFTLIALMLAVYVVLDGFDFGAGIVHLWVARTDEERRTVLASIGPLWDGNEVWLIAAGGVLLLAFPRVYAAGFSGFYLPLMIALWLLVMRGLAIEFRSHHINPLWRSFWDGAFAFSSSLMAVILGAALGNVVRGVPLDETGFFAGPLFTDFRPGGRPGVLDWYTTMVGLFALFVLAGHGALYLVWKCAGDLRERARRVALRAWCAALLLGVPTTYATARVQPRLFAHLIERRWTWILLAVIAGSLGLLLRSFRRRQELAAFLASALFILGMLGATAAGLFPDLLISTLGPEFDLGVRNAASGADGLRLGLAWWIPAMLLAAAYFLFLFRFFRGKILIGADGPES